jgi:hypothetical protein
LFRDFPNFSFSLVLYVFPQFPKKVIETIISKNNLNEFLNNVRKNNTITNWANLQSLCESSKLWTLTFNQRPILELVLKSSTIPYCKYQIFPRLESPTAILNDLIEHHFSQKPSIPNWSKNLRFYLKNLQTIIKPKSQTQLATMMLSPSLNHQFISDQPLKLTMVRVTMSEEDEWWRLDVFLSKNTQWLSQRFSLEMFLKSGKYF